MLLLTVVGNICCSVTVLVWHKALEISFELSTGCIFLDSNSYFYQSFLQIGNPALQTVKASSLICTLQGTCNREVLQIHGLLPYFLSQLTFQNQWHVTLILYLASLIFILTVFICSNPPSKFLENLTESLPESSSVQCLSVNQSKGNDWPLLLGRCEIHRL